MHGSEVGVCSRLTGKRHRELLAISVLQEVLTCTLLYWHAPGHSCVCRAEGPGAAQPNTALETQLSCALENKALPETPRAVPASGWTQSVGSTSCAVGFCISHGSLGVHQSVLWLIWKYWKDLESQRRQCEFCDLCNIKQLRRVQALRVKSSHCWVLAQTIALLKPLNLFLKGTGNRKKNPTNVCYIKYKEYQNMIF